MLHTHAFGQNAWGSLLGRLAGVPVVIAHEHNRDFNGRALHPVIDRELIARCAAAMIVVSEDARRRMIEVERIPPERLVLLPNGVQALPRGDGRALRADLGIGRGDPVVGHRLHHPLGEGARRPGGGRGTAGQALSSPPPADRRQGPDRGRVEAVTEQVGLSDRVHFDGRPNRRTRRPRRNRRRGDLLGLRGQPALDPGVHGCRQADRGHGGRRDPGGDRGRGPRRSSCLPATRRHSPLPSDGVLADLDGGSEMGARARDRCRREFSLDRTVESLQRLYEELHSRRNGNLATGSRASASMR